ncbi:hypothetical protein H310_01686 [Aphanomyces invadans]|uniref:Thioredoxin-like fold domain-containing protein n=1 Tax=Aphanomyces invadans TaxID=157072 RepID=A0A024USG0_9STRA|nr:hypothetical protein H310_01686 [Aphanomyces invadans]ETW09294.1 hypothetical protein H310_01686 [Aphanomyces invadans]|eukprot:XP_008863099.1 hypothetical protein H310_01686 [Aphanomyces invadans]
MQLLLPIATTLAALACVHGRVPIPTAPLGFTYGQGSANATVQLDAFVDLLCPDSKAAYPALKQLAETLPNQFLLRFHQFPLPYHHQGFPIAQATHTITHALGRDTFVKWLETVYDVQDEYWNKQTEDMGQKQVTAKIEALAKSTFPSLTDAQWKDGMTGHGGTKRDLDTRTEWKHACTRGISGTPQFLLNDVPINVDTTWTYDDWMGFLEPLLDVQNEATLKVGSNIPPTVEEETTASLNRNSKLPRSSDAASMKWNVAGYVGASLGLGFALY